MNHKSVVLFGGSFDPPHLGHLLVIQQAFELIPQIDELWLLPAYRHSFEKSLSPAPHRLAMCNLLINRLPDYLIKQVKLCPIEIDYQLSGSTFETWKHLQKEKKYLTDHDLFSPKYQIQNTKYSFLIGSDQIPYFTKWHNYQELLQAMPFYVYPRANYPLKPLLPGMTALESPTQVITNISSTLVRHRLSKKMPVESLIPPSIQAYLKAHHLYQ